jgi:4-alpha-glucanotransferase
VSDALRARAVELGVQTNYHDVDGALHHADDVVVAHVVAILEADRSKVAAASRLGEPLHIAASGPYNVRARVDEATLSVDGEPIELSVRHGDDHDSIDLPLDLAWGCHALDFSAGDDSGTSTVVVAPPLMPRDAAFDGRGGVFAPTYALWAADHPLPSFTHLHQLATTLRRHGVEVVATLPLYATFLDDPFDPSPYSPISRLHWNEVYLADEGLPHAPEPEMTETVDWRALAARRRRQLIEAAKHLDENTLHHLETFVHTHPDVASYARFQAQREAGGDPIVERSHLLAQYLADRQLAAIRDDPDAAAVALDLPIGSHPDGFEVWSDPTMFATGVSVGAPPDTFFAEGQSWGFPPPLPGAMRASGQRLWRQLIARAGRHADILRIDHAMAVERLWWVPDGFSARDGVYVHYPREEILAVVAASAAAVGLTIVGEDLGTVPPEVSDAFDRWDMLGMYEEQFHLDAEALPHIPRRTVAGIRTHDMEPLAALVASADTTDYRERLGTAHGTTIEARWDDVADHMLTRLAASDAYLVVADLDDLIGETRPHNLPGRVVDGLWARRLPRPAPDVLDDPDVRRRLSILGRTTP